MATDFTPVASLLGGLLIGLSVVWMMASLGRIAGVSGLLGSLLPDRAARGASRRISLGFVLGMLAASVSFLWLQVPIAQSVSTNLPVMAVAGLLVGFGATLGSGCTSGHGVCGLSRLSSRSMVATGVFMLTAGVTVYVLRHLVGAGW